MRFPHTSVFQSLFTIAALLTPGFFTNAACGNDIGGSPLVIRHHTTPEGEFFFAAALKPTDVAFTSVQRHVVLMDTSASQTGQIRESSLALVSSIVAGLSPRAEVQILAVDTECESMTDGFVMAASRDINEAIQKLSLRTPLGATNLKTAFRQILTSAGGQPTSVVYIGDGMTVRDIILTDELNALITQLTDKQISVHSLVLGPRTDSALPTILANLTGGTAETATAGQEKAIAVKVAKALTVAPQAVSDIRVDGRPLKLAGRNVSLLRPDRHTVVFGEGQIPHFKALTATTPNGTTASWDSSLCERAKGGAELKHLFTQITSSNGINADVASLNDLNRKSQQFADSMEQTIAGIEYLTRRGRTQEARAYLKEAVRMDGGNPGLNTILTGFGQPPQDEPADPQPPEPAPPADPIDANPIVPGDEAPVPPVADPAVLTPAPAPPAFPAAQQPDPLQDVEAAIQLQTQILTQETSRAIDQANRLGFDQPEYAVSLLKDALETIRSSGDISSDIRRQLESRVINALSTVQNRKDINAQQQRQIAVEQAVIQAQKANMLEDQLEEERLAILIDQVRGLLDRGRHGDLNGFEDGEAVSRIALDLKPGNGPATQGLVMSEALGQLSKAYRLVNLRHDRFLEVLYQVELSHVPFPDEPPIQYPPADVWRVLSLTRKPRYEAFDLRIEAPVEKWLRQMLDKPIPPLDFPGDAPLNEILEQIAVFYTTTYGAGGGASGTDFRMTIYPDYAELDLEGITSLEDVTVSNINFEGLTLRNALKLIFDQTTDPELTYVIENEVFKVTTLAKAESEDNLVTRVYPVGDLVIPPIQLGGGGGGGQQGGGLGGGQQGGGLGGGQQGGFGGGGGGGGQGFMNIPPEIIEQMQDAAQNGISTEAVEQLKKKPTLK